VLVLSLTLFLNQLLFGYAPRLESTAHRYSGSAPELEAKAFHLRCYNVARPLSAPFVPNVSEGKGWSERAPCNTPAWHARIAPRLFQEKSQTPTRINWGAHQLAFLRRFRLYSTEIAVSLRVRLVAIALILVYSTRFARVFVIHGRTFCRRYSAAAKEVPERSTSQRQRDEEWCIYRLHVSEKR